VPSSSFPKLVEQAPTPPALPTLVQGMPRGIVWVLKELHSIKNTSLRKGRGSGPALQSLTGGAGTGERGSLQLCRAGSMALSHFPRDPGYS